MKDTVLTAQRKRIEITTFILCFILANILNLYAIMTYNGSYLELFTSIGYVTLTACVLYISWSLLRIIFYGFIFLLKRKNID